MAHVELILQNGGICLIDECDHEALSVYKWFRKSNGYVGRDYRENGKMFTCYIHREIMKPPANLMIDHINRNPLDNRRSNLRLTNHQLNQINSKDRLKNKCGYKGVYTKGERFRACICLNGKNYHLGVFDTAEEAAEKYRKTAILLFGEFAMNPQNYDE